MLSPLIGLLRLRKNNIMGKKKRYTQNNGNESAIGRRRKKILDEIKKTRKKTHHRYMRICYAFWLWSMVLLLHHHRSWISLGISICIITMSNDLKCYKNIHKHYMICERYFSAFFFLYNGFGLALLAWHQHENILRKKKTETRTHMQLRVYYNTSQYHLGSK